MESMIRRYSFVALAMVAVGLIFNACDIFETGLSSGNDEKYEKLIIMGTAEGGTAERKEVKTEFSTTRTIKKEIMTPQTNDSYEIIYEAVQVSKGTIEVNGTTIIFKPANGGISFEGTLTNVNSKPSLTFPRGIPTSTGTIMGYRSLGSSDPISPEFDTSGDLDNKAISLTAGQSVPPFTVSAKTNTGGIPYYQWYKSAQNSYTGTAIAGATSASYVVPTTMGGTFYYYVKIGNASGGVLSSKIKEVKVIATEIVVGNGSGMTPFYSLKEAIMTLLGNNNTSPAAYTVNFAIDLPYPLLIDKEAFPGTGKLTIKSSAQFTKGIYITRSDVELNGLDIAINNTDNAAKYLSVSEPCAVLISDRYYLASLVTPKPPKPELDSYQNYLKYLSDAIKRVSIVDCNIVFRADYPKAIVGVCVDPDTAGRASDTRIKITGTTLNVYNAGGENALCFYGNNTDFSNNTFTSSGVVAYIPFLFQLTYGDLSATNTVSFSNNKFTSNAVSNKAFEVYVNTAYQGPYWDDCIKELKTIKETCDTFGEPNHKFGELLSKYRRLIEILFAQIPSPAGKEILMYDCYSTTSSSPGVFYRMDSENSIGMRLYQ